MPNLVTMSLENHADWHAQYGSLHNKNWFKHTIGMLGQHTRVQLMLSSDLFDNVHIIMHVGSST